MPGLSWPTIGGFADDSNGVPSFIVVPPPPPPPPKPPALKITFLLNDGVRFDRPGHYRLYMSDHLVSAGLTGTCVSGHGAPGARSATALKWSDHLAGTWELDREAEFRRVAKAARSQGLALERR